MRRRDIADQINDDPRGRTETEWLDSLEFLVSRLSDATGAYLELGRYWIEDFPGHSGAGMSARVRSKKPLRGVNCDYWEAAICLSGGHRGARADAFVIPYLRGSRITSEGRMADRSSQGEEEFWWFNFTGGEFQSKGSSWPDGPGEWSWVKQPGDEYQQNVDCRISQSSIRNDAPVYVDVIVSDLAHIKTYRNRLRPSTPRISLLHVNRNREHANLVPWNFRPPRPGSQDVLTVDDGQTTGRDALQIDLRRLRVRGGWLPGRYHLSLRVQNFHKPDDWSWSSEISAPINFEIE